MGLPDINITFKKAADTAIKRSGKGIVAVLLSDSTALTAQNLYNKLADVSTDDWTSANYGYISNIFKGAPGGVLAVRVSTLADSLSAIESERWDWLCTPIASSATTISDYISTQRAAGKTFKAVVANATAPNCEGVVNLTTSGIKVTSGDGAVEVTTEGFTPRIAGILAGLDMSRSATYYPLPEVVEITASATPDNDIDAGKLIIVYDGENYKLGRAVTSLTTSQTVSTEFKKIKAVVGADMLAMDISRSFMGSYIGQIANNYDNKQVLVAAINSYLSSLEGSVLDNGYDNHAEVSYEKNLEYLTENSVDTSAYSEAQVRAAGTGSTVFLELHIKLLDAMEDMTLNVNLN